MPVLFTVPNVVGLTQAAAIVSLGAVGFSASLQYAASSTVPAGIVISQAPAANTSWPNFIIVTLVVSTGVLPAAGFGGDVWGAGGGSATPSSAPNAILPALSAAQQPENAVVSNNQSVMTTLSKGAKNTTDPASSFPTAPTVG